MTWCLVATESAGESARRPSPVPAVRTSGSADPPLVNISIRWAPARRLLLFRGPIKHLTSHMIPATDSRQSIPTRRRSGSLSKDTPLQTGVSQSIIERAGMINSAPPPIEVWTALLSPIDQSRRTLCKLTTLPDIAI